MIIIFILLIGIFKWIPEQQEDREYFNSLTREEQQVEMDMLEDYNQYLEDTIDRTP
jgi:hypothetical protein